jgi:O-antigen/teichoic acid export membrane protein
VSSEVASGPDDLDPGAMPQLEPNDGTEATHGGAQLAMNAAAYWLGTGVTLLGSLVRGKVAAVVLGPAGLGVTSQLAMFSSLVVAVAALGLGTGGVKLIAAARARGDEDDIRRLVSFLLWGPTAAGLVLFIGVALAAEPLAQLLLQDTDYADYLIVGAVAIPISLMLTSFQLVMQAYERAYRLAVNSVVTAILVTAAVVPLTVAWGIRGAVVAVPLSAAATLALFCIREPWVLRLGARPRRLGPASRRALSVLAGASMAASVLALASDTLLRASTVHLLGVDQIGLYQPVQVLTSVVLTQMAGVLSLVLLPRLSFQLGRGASADVLYTLTKAAQASVVFIVPVLLLLMALRDVFIVVLFDSSFLGISGVLAVQLVAEVPRFAAYALGSALLPAGLVRPWLVSSVVSTALRVVTGLALLPAIGLYALAFSTVVQWLAVLVYTGWVLKTKMDWQPDRRLGWLLVLGLLVVGGGCGLSIATRWGELLLPVLALVWVLRLGRHEVTQVLSAVVNLVRARRAA